MITCHELTLLITDYLEGAMAEPERVRFVEHLAVCPPCRRYLKQMELTIATTGRRPAVEPEPPVRDAFLAAFRAWKGGPP